MKFIHFSLMIAILFSVNFSHSMQRDTVEILVSNQSKKHAHFFSIDPSTADSYRFRTLLPSEKEKGLCSARSLLIFTSHGRYDVVKSWNDPMVNLYYQAFAVEKNSGLLSHFLIHQLALISSSKVQAIIKADDAVELVYTDSESK